MNLRAVVTAAWAAAMTVAAAAAAPSPERISALNCAACHAATPAQAAWLVPAPGPRLEALGERVSGAWVEQFLSHPGELSPGGTMPDLLSGLPATERPAAARALTHFLLANSADRFARGLPDRGAVARGETLYHEIGCVACHAPQKEGAAVPAATPFPDLTAKWSFTGLRAFLLDPLATHPAGRMPGLRLTDREAADVAHYLLRETRVPANLEAAFYRGRVNSLGELDTAPPARTEPATGFVVSDEVRQRGSAVRFAGWLQLEQPGQYTFYLTTAGAARFAIDGDWLTGEESWETGQVAEQRKLRLAPGPHAITVDYVHRGNKPAALKMEWAGPGFERGEVPPARLTSQKERVPAPAPYAIDAALAARGRELYGQLHCAACHADQPPTGPALTALQPGRGCLAPTPAPGVPDYRLMAETRTQLTAELAALNRPTLPAPSPREALQLRLTAFQCLACHVRDGKGGPAGARDAFFTSNGTDLGDEGRLPPRLDGVGDKLQPAWLAKVLAEGAAVRPYLNTRMPVFGTRNVGALAEMFIALDRSARTVSPSPDAPEEQREAGRLLVGTKGLSCVACHPFNRRPAQALQVIDLITATERLNPDWFRQFLLDPSRFHPGTRMPGFWPGGVSLMTNVLNGVTERQHAALWTYLADGARAKFPEGLSRQNLELIVGGEAVLYRGKLWEAGFRAVAAGYPGGLNSAFDAEEMRLALLWRGRFLNAGAHWTSQGMGQIRPLGNPVVVFPHGAPLAVLATPETPWPTEPPKALGFRFRGYELDRANQPTLRYAWREAEIEDFIQPLPANGPTGLRRTLRFPDRPAPDHAYWRLARGRLAPVGANAWRLDEAVTLRLPTTTLATVRGTGARQELLVPAGPQANLEVEYVW